MKDFKMRKIIIDDANIAKNYLNKQKNTLFGAYYISKIEILLPDGTAHN